MDVVPDQVRERFSELVRSIVGRGRIPAADRDDVAEELAGHLDEAYRSGVVDGLTPEAAADRAVAALGSVGAVSRDFMVTYRGRLWAATIGQLLPIATSSDQPPGIVVWLARFDWVIAILSGVAALAVLATASPARAVISAAFGAFSAVVLALAATAIRRRQSWAIAVSAVICLENALIFFASFSRPSGGTMISLNGLAGLILLLGVWGNLRVLDDWGAGSGRISLKLGVPVGIGVVGWSLIAGFAPNMPDPTQIGPSDIRATALITCDVPPGPSELGESFVPVRTLDLRVTYDRVDAWPRGLLRDTNSWGDIIEFDAGRFSFAPGDVQARGTLQDGSSEPVDVSWLVDVPTELVTPDDQGRIAGEIHGSDQRPGRTIRVVVPTWPIPADDQPEELEAPPESIVGMVKVHHLDRFTLQGFGGCGQEVALEPRG